jgi:hypothetical protein
MASTTNNIDADEYQKTRSTWNGARVIEFEEGKTLENAEFFRFVARSKTKL